MTRAKLLVFLFLLPLFGWSQDLHFSQFYASPLHLNPGMTGVFDFRFKEKDLRFSSIYRQQWRTITSPFNGVIDGVSKRSPFNTTIVSLDGLLKRHKDLDGNFVGLGALFYDDYAGDLSYSSKYSSFSISYGIALNRDHTSYISGGASFALGFNSFNPNNGVFDNQWNGLDFDPSLPTGESFPITSSGYSDLSTGIAFSTFPANRVKHTFGIALFHINNPDQGILGEEAPLPRKFVVHYEGQIPLKYNRNLIPLGFYHTQANAHEFSGGLMMQLNFRESEYRDFKDIRFGGAYRIVGNRDRLVGSDALIFLVRTRYRNFLFGASYDSNFSGLTTATRTVGAFEFSLVYYLDLYKKNRQPKRKLKDYKPVCPDE